MITEKASRGIKNQRDIRDVFEGIE